MRRRSGLSQHVLTIPPKLRAWDSRIGLGTSERPVASIIVPVFNKLEYTLGCLAALAASGNCLPYEIIVVDDASTDGTSSVVPAIAGVTYVRNDENLGFIGSCNRGAALARGRYLVFLNNDTAVQSDWLDALVETFKDFPGAGLVGAKLLYPNGQLQEAGGIIYADARAGNYGRFDAPMNPRFTSVRDVDYCSGAALAIPAALFSELGGFDDYYKPAYYEDADLAMRVRQRGLRVLYQPRSLVVHFEGVSSGNEGEGGAKSFQDVNRHKFLERWGKVLDSDHAPWGTHPDIAANRNRRVLFLAEGGDSLDKEFLAACRKLSEEGIPATVRLESCARSEMRALLESSGIECWDRAWPHSLHGWLRRHSPRHSLAWYLDDASRRNSSKLVAKYLAHADLWCGSPDVDRILARVRLRGASVP